MFTRKLGRSGIDVSALGMGCWAIGGPFWREGKPIGWGEVNDEESIRAINRAVELGVNLFDTADVYGCGHSETILGKALGSRRDKVIIATKFGNGFIDGTREATNPNASPDYIVSACEASLRRLNTEYIDLYQFHWGTCEIPIADPVLETLEKLVRHGKVRWYGWSTDDPDRARFFAAGEHCTAIQQALNMFDGNLRTLAVCEELNLASLNRNPLSKGLLTGKFDESSKFPPDDIRSGWNMTAGAVAKSLKKLQAIRDILTQGGRSLAQAALAWLWTKSPNTIPIPGFKSVRQVEENIAATDFGPLSKQQMVEIQEVLTGA